MTYTPPINAMLYLIRYGFEFDNILRPEKFSDCNYDLIGDI